MANTKHQIKVIQVDIFASLESAVNTYIAAINRAIDKIEFTGFVLDSGNQAHTASIQTFVPDVVVQTRRVKNILQDNINDLQNAVNAALLALNEDNEILELHLNTYTMENGNRSYCVYIVYDPSEDPGDAVQVRILEKDTAVQLETAVNTLMTTLGLTFSTALGILRSDQALDSGNKIYTCVVPYSLVP